jgi:hypothetical protein
LIVYYFHNLSPVLLDFAGAVGGHDLKALRIHIDRNSNKQGLCGFSC